MFRARSLWGRGRRRRGGAVIPDGWFNNGREHKCSETVLCGVGVGFGVGVLSFLIGGSIMGGNTSVPSPFSVGSGSYTLWALRYT